MQISALPYAFTSCVYDMSGFYTSSSGGVVFPAFAPLLRKESCFPPLPHSFGRSRVFRLCPTPSEGVRGSPSRYGYPENRFRRKLSLHSFRRSAAFPRNPYSFRRSKERAPSPRTSERPFRDDAHQPHTTAASIPAIRCCCGQSDIQCPSCRPSRDRYSVRLIPQRPRFPRFGAVAVSLISSA